MTYPTIRPEIIMDFANSRQLDPRINFSRPQTSGQATYINPDTGMISYAYAHQPRFEKGGLLIEESRTNSVQYSEDLSNAYWDKQNCSLGATTTAPDGTNSAYLVIPDSANTTNHRVKISVSGLSQGRSQSCFAKAGGYNYATFKGQNVDCVFDLSTGTANNGGKMIPYPNGWYRCIFNGSAYLGSNVGWGVGVNSGGGGAGNGTDGVYLWGLQWEDDKSFETSYIPTSGSALTRASDICTIKGDTWDSMFADGSNSIFAKGSFNYTVDGTTFPINLTGPNLYTLDGKNGTWNKVWYSYVENTYRGTIDGTGGGGGAIDLFHNTVLEKTGVFKSCLTFDTSNDRITSAWNGGLVSNGAAAGASYWVRVFRNQDSNTGITIGGKNISNRTPLNGCVARITLYSSAMSDEQLEAITL